MHDGKTEGSGVENEYVQAHASNACMLLSLVSVSAKAAAAFHCGW